MAALVSCAAPRSRMPPSPKMLGALTLEMEGEDETEVFEAETQLLQRQSAVVDLLGSLSNSEAIRDRFIGLLTRKSSLQMHGVDSSYVPILFSSCCSCSSSSRRRFSEIILPVASNLCRTPNLDLSSLALVVLSNFALEERFRLRFVHDGTVNWLVPLFYGSSFETQKTNKKARQR